MCAFQTCQAQCARNWPYHALVRYILRFRPGLRSSGRAGSAFIEDILNRLDITALSNAAPNTVETAPALTSRPLKLRDGITGRCASIQDNFA